MIDDKLICRGVSIEYKRENFALYVPKENKFDFVYDESEFSIQIEQHISRKITIKSKEFVDSDMLIDIVQLIEKLIMIYESQFIPISSIKFFNEKNDNAKLLDIKSIEYKSRRLSYYNLSALCINNNAIWLDYKNFINSEFLKHFNCLLDELGIVFNLMLYSVAKHTYTVDIRVAFLIQLAEPMIELLKIKTTYFTELNPGRRGTTLKLCLDSLIKKYGEDIFKKEINSGKYDEFLKFLKNSRTRVMHVKSNFEGDKYLNGKESILYSTKLFFLYRHILLTLLRFDKEQYIINFEKSINQLDKWQNVSDDFIDKL